MSTVPPAHPHPRRGLCAALLAALLLVGLLPAGTPPATAAQDRSRTLAPASFHDYEEMLRELEAIEARSAGTMRLESAGTSNRGRQIPLAVIGSGDRRVLYIAQQHGNEALGAEAAISAVKTLSTSTSPAIRDILDELTVLVMPRVNPDGAERYWRQNDDPDCDPGALECIPGRGFDINRWHSPFVQTTEVPVPEARAVREVFTQWQPELVVDYHGQLSYQNDDGDAITASLDWPRFTSDVEITPERAAAVTYSQQVSALAARSLRHANGVVTRYPPGTTIGTARNAYGYQGAASILLEQDVSGDQKAAGSLISAAYRSMLDILSAVSDGSVFDIDVAEAEALPPRGPATTDPNPKRPQPCPVPGNTGAGVVSSEDTPFYDYVLAYEDERLLARGSESYVVPTQDEACAFGAATQLLRDDEPEAAAALVDGYGYDVVELTDPDTDRRLLLLAERLDGSSVARGWGLFAVDPGSSSDVVIESAYAGSATFSERLAATAFDEFGAKAFLMNGAHRETNQADDVTYEPANVTTSEVSVFRAVHAATVDRGDRVLELLGAGGGSRDVTVTSQLAPASAFAADLSASLRESGYEVCLFGTGDCDDLASTANLQGLDTRALKADWVALYPSLEIRRLASRRAELVAALSVALDG